MTFWKFNIIVQLIIYATKNSTRDALFFSSALFSSIILKF